MTALWTAGQLIAQPISSAAVRKQARPERRIARGDCCDDVLDLLILAVRGGMPGALGSGQDFATAEGDWIWGALLECRACLAAVTA